MITQEINSKELLGEQIGSYIKGKINNGIYFLFVVILIGGLSNVYLISRGLVKGWTKTRIKGNR